MAPLNGSKLYSGHVIRHFDVFTEKKSENHDSFKTKLNNLDESNAKKFKSICDHLIIGLRDRYSGSPSENGNKKLVYFNAIKTNGNINVTQEGILKALQNLSKTFDENDALTLMVLCTHRHTSFSRVASYPSRLKSILKNTLKLTVNENDLKNIENNILQNINVYSTDSIFLTLTNKKLQYLNLIEAKLERADLQRADLRKANLQRANLDGADLQEANLQEANLQESNLQESNLQGADLEKVNLQKANLQKANLHGAILEKANFEGANLSGANFEGAYFEGTNFRGVNLSGANFKKANFKGTNFEGANLSGANFEGAYLERVDFRNTNLKGANLEKVNLRGANFTKATFDDTALIKLRFSGNLDYDFNHINNRSGSILTAINSIDDKYLELKQELFLEVCNYLLDKDITGIFDALCDIIFNSEFDYRKVIVKVSTFCDKLFHLMYTMGNAQALKLTRNQISFFLGLLSEMKNEMFNDFTIVNNGFFIQLIYCAANFDSDEDDKNYSYKLYDKYIKNNPSISKAKQPDLYLDKINNKSLPWYAFIAESNEVLIVSNLYLKRLYVNELESNAEIPQWSDCYYFDEGGKNKVPNHLSTLFNTFNIFSSRYEFECKMTKFLKHLNLLKLESYGSDFSEALKLKEYFKKLVTKEHQQKLAKIFNAFFVETKQKNHATEDIKDILNLKAQHISDIFKGKHQQIKCKSPFLAISANLSSSL
jgi:uncharacterized protein YjbI with pentapeptide repeats